MATAAIPIVLSLAPVALEIIEKYGPIAYELILKIVARDMPLDYLKKVTTSTQFDKISRAIEVDGKQSSVTLPRLFKILGAAEASLVLGKILAQDIDQMNKKNSNNNSNSNSNNSGTPPTKINPDVAALTQLVINGLKKSKYLTKAKGGGGGNKEQNYYPQEAGNNSSSSDDSDDDDDDYSNDAAIAAQSSLVQCLKSLFSHVEFARLCFMLAEQRRMNKNNKRARDTGDDTDDDFGSNASIVKQRSFASDGDYELEQKWRAVVYKVKQAVLNSSDIRTLSDSRHDVRQMFENLTWQNVVHLLHFLSTRAVRAPCKICLQPNQLEHVFFDMWANRHDLYNVLNVFYNCDLVVANEFVHFLKPTCYPDDGTYPWDMNIFMASLFKYHNYFKVYEPVTYHGVLYSKDMSDANLEIFAWQIVQSAVRRHAFLVACGSIQKPTHWCGIFIDTSISSAFFYNSIAHQHQLNWKLIDVFNNLCDQLGVEYLKIKTRITNTKRLQGKSNLCGHFVYDFFSTMLRQPANRLCQVFNEYTNVPDTLNKNNKSADILDSTLHTKIKNKFHFMPRTNQQPDRMFYSYLKKMKSSGN